MFLYEVQFVAIENGEILDAGMEWMPLPEIGDVFQEEGSPDFEVTRVVFANFENRTAEVEGVFINDLCT